MRPRDAIMFLNEALRMGAGKHKLSWDNIYKAEVKYSKQRLEALRDEWKDPYFDIDKTFEPFRGQRYHLDRSRLTSIFDDVVMVLADPKFRGTPWLTVLSEPILESSNGHGWFDMYGGLLNLFYKVSLIGISKTGRPPTIYSYQDDELPDSCDIPDEAVFEIHPAFHRALDIRLDSIETLSGRRV